MPSKSFRKISRDAELTEAAVDSLSAVPAGAAVCFFGESGVDVSERLSRHERNHGRLRRLRIKVAVDLAKRRAEAEGQRIAFLDDDLALAEIGAEIMRHHRERLGGGNDLGVGIGLRKRVDVCRVVGLHMLDDKIIGESSV